VIDFQVVGGRDWDRTVTPCLVSRCSAGVSSELTMSLVQIKPPQPNSLLFQSLPQTCNPPNLYRSGCSRTSRLKTLPTSQMGLVCRSCAGITSYMPTFGYLSELGGCLGDDALTEIRRFQMAEKPPSTDNSTPFT
jgi:hypothetical protein